MLDPRPLPLAIAAVTVLAGGMTAATTIDPEPISAVDAPTAGPEPPAAPDRAEAPAGEGGTLGGADKGGGADGADEGGATTQRTRERMLERNLDDAVRSYQDLARRDDT